MIVRNPPIDGYGRSIGNSPDEEHIDPHGECRHEIHRLQSALATARRDALEEAMRIAEPKVTSGICQCGRCDERRYIVSEIRALLSQSVEVGRPAGGDGWDSAHVGFLADAMWQLLDDMGTSGTCVCLAAKAQARIAYEPFKTDDSPLDWPVEDAMRIYTESKK